MNRKKKTSFNISFVCDVMCMHLINDYIYIYKWTGEKCDATINEIHMCVYEMYR